MYDILFHPLSKRHSHINFNFLSDLLYLTTCIFSLEIEIEIEIEINICALRSKLCLQMFSATLLNCVRSKN